MVAMMVLAGVSVAQLASATTSGATGDHNDQVRGDHDQRGHHHYGQADDDHWGDDHHGQGDHHDRGHHDHSRSDHHVEGDDDNHPGDHHQLDRRHGVDGSDLLAWRGNEHSRWWPTPLHRRRFAAVAVRGACPTGAWRGEPAGRNPSTSTRVAERGLRT
jgi:hypothetical protein